MEEDTRLSGVRKATIVKTKVGPTSLSVISIRKEGWHSRRMQIVLIALSEPEDRRSTIPDRPNPKFAQIRSVQSGSTSTRVVLPTIKPCDGLHYMCKACRPRQRRSVCMHSSGIFSAIETSREEHDTPFDMEVEDWFAIYDAQGGKCALLESR